MILIILEPKPVDCHIEIDGHDITRTVRRLELDADAGSGATLVRLTLLDNVTIIGVPGRLEFNKAPARVPPTVEE